MHLCFRLMNFCVEIYFGMMWFGCVLICYFFLFSSHSPMLFYYVASLGLFGVYNYTSLSKFLDFLELRIWVYIKYYLVIYGFFVVVENEIAVYLNVPFSYLSNISSKYVTRFDYYDNLLKSMRRIFYFFFILLLYVREWEI